MARHGGATAHRRGGIPLSASARRGGPERPVWDTVGRGRQGITASDMRIGIDLGGTKIAAVALDANGNERARAWNGTPRGYSDTLAALAAVVATVAAGSGDEAAGVGLGVPGLVDFRRGVVLRAVNLPWLEGRCLVDDLAAALRRPVALTNDANAFTLSEAVDGAAAGASTVFGVVLGTGVGGGAVVDGRVLDGANGLAGEWGHMPLPWREAGDGPPLPCGCGRSGCIETVLSGAGLTALHRWRTGEVATPPEIAARALAGDGAAAATLARHRDALARALTSVVAVLDPEAIVVGGGLSRLPGLIDGLPALVGRRSLAPVSATRFRLARHGAESGLRGAAWLVRGAY